MSKGEKLLIPYQGNINPAESQKHEKRPKETGGSALRDF